MPATTRRPHRAFATLATVAMLATATIALSGCNTLAGAGQDVSSVGHDISGGATATQQGIHQSTGAAVR